MIMKILKCDLYITFILSILFYSLCGSPKLDNVNVQVSLPFVTRVIKAMVVNVKVLDAGQSMQLSKYIGNDLIDGDPLWISRFLLTNPDAIYQTHLDFLRAGSDIIQTFTYQASITGFVKYMNLSKEKSLGLIKRAVEIAKKAIQTYKEEIKGRQVPNPEPLISGSVGPYAASLHDGSEYTSGVYKESMATIVEWHKPRIETLIENGVDLLAIETIPSLKEAQALVELLKQYPGTKAWLSFSCKTDGKSIVDGTNFKEAVLKCYKANPEQIIACGVNCLIPRAVTPLLKSISKQEINEFIPMVAYPNSGEKFSTTTQSWTVDNDFHPPEEFLKEWLNLGVRYIGGCCRTTIEDLKIISAEVQNWKKNHED